MATWYDRQACVRVARTWLRHRATSPQGGVLLQAVWSSVAGSHFARVVAAPPRPLGGQHTDVEVAAA